ncbi:GDSL-type esterase/lipase family protein [Chroococcidiopsis sp. CCNUC1]|uniref:GDSL-type esterase/lipase family protein n=1 Tax=Chroococcidiopsis sp. CCNUC1 TaxID=2653189 RepID=UPI0020201A86|nr:GDSL-type esterase/lipase family protein [Chroococcidiopsis sp. CCNUC1]URD51286.1 GDSL-type esterase/lipase family protein [Chroococcidiopsis sp. CCNUC1]
MNALFISLSLNALALTLAILFVAKKGGVSYLRTKLSRFARNRDRFRIQVANPSYYLQRVSQFQLAPISNSDIVFLGDSITDECEWSELLENPHVKNRGISGDTTMGVLHRLEDIVSSQPAKIFIMIGINNFIHYQQSAVEILVDYQKIIVEICDRSPQTEIFIQSVLPINRTKSGLNVSDREILQLNSALQKLATEYSLTYIDLYSYLSDEQHQLKECYTLDGVHLNGQAYSIWKQVIEKYI